MILLVLVAWFCWLFLPSLRVSFCGAFCGVCGRFCGGCSISVGVAASAVLRAFYIVFAWCGAAGGVQLSRCGVAALLAFSAALLVVDRLGGWAWFLGFCGAL